MPVDDVAIEFCGQTYDLPVLLVGNVRRKVREAPALEQVLDNALAGRTPVAVLEDGQVEAFYLAASSVFRDFDVNHEGWQRLLTELQAKCDY